MGYRLPPLAWLRTFDAAARHASFAAAARELHMTQPAVSYHIRSLERDLSAPLFERHARRVELTRLGRAYLPSVRQALAQLSAATSGLFGLPGERKVSVRCAATLAMLWLAPRLSRFTETFPNIEVQLYTSTWPEEYRGGPLDIDIRLHDGSIQGGEVSLLKREQLVAVASPKVAAGLGDAATPADCTHERLIHIMGHDAFWETWFHRAGIYGAELTRRITVDNSVAALELAASGYGLALVFETFARPYLETERLVKPVAHSFESDRSHYVILGERDTPVSPEALLFRDWLLQQAHDD